MASIAETVMQQIGGANLTQLSQEIGADETTTMTAVQTALPMLLAGLARDSTPAGGVVDAGFLAIGNMGILATSNSLPACVHRSIQHTQVRLFGSGATTVPRADFALAGLPTSRLATIVFTPTDPTAFLVTPCEWRWRRKDDTDEKPRHTVVRAGAFFRAVSTVHHAGAAEYASLRFSRRFFTSGHSRSMIEK